MKIKKRNGTLEEFDINKILNAVTKAFKECGYEDLPVQCREALEIYFNSDFNNKEFNSVEAIQDAIENLLMSFTITTDDGTHKFEEHFYYKDVAKAFILYREKHREERFEQERIDYMNKYSHSSENAATSSETDANANVAIKNVANLEGEVYKLKNRSIQRRRMRIKLKEKFPEVAEQYEKDLKHHIIYCHDEASSPVPKQYCMAVTLYPLLLKGTSTMDGLQTQPPKNLDSFCGQFINLIFLLSSQCKGAVGVGEFFNFFDWACVQEWGEDYHKHDNKVITTKACKRQETISSRIEQSFQNIVYSINQPAGNRSYQSPFVNFNYFDKYYWNSLFEDFIFPDGSRPKWERVSYLQKKFMKWFNNERTKTLLTYPVESLCILNDGKDYVDKEYKNLAAEMWSEGHSFFVYTSDNADSVAACCRLRSDVKQFTSTTGLTGVEIGSVNVITLNLNRIMQDFFDEKPTSWETYKLGIKDYLISILTRVYKYQIAYKDIMYEWEANGMITASNAGYIHMNKLYSTFGINGLNEAAEFFGLEVSNNDDYIKFCTFILNIIRDFINEHQTSRYMLNLEQVPAESLGVKNYNWDKEDGYYIKDGKNLYNSYIYDAHNPNTTVFDKLTLQGGEIANALSGGQACHLNLEDHLSKKQYLAIMDYAIKVGCNYFTFNIPNTQCDKCGKIYKQPLTKCPSCNSEEMTQWTRIIGFMRPVKGFSKERQVEEHKRIYEKKNNI